MIPFFTFVLEEGKGGGGGGGEWHPSPSLYTLELTSLISNNIMIGLVIIENFTDSRNRIEGKPIRHF